MKTKILILFLTVAELLFEGCASTPPEPDVPPPAAKSGPSFEETRDWIITTMEQYGGYDVDGHSVFKNVSINNSGRLTFDEYIYSNDYSKPDDVRHTTIPLGVITDIKGDFTPVRGGSGSIDIKTGNVAAIDYEDSVGAGHDNHIDIDVQNQPKAVSGQPMPENQWEITKRLVTALQHMTDICKGTYTAPTKTAQPF